MVRVEGGSAVVAMLSVGCLGSSAGGLVTCGAALVSQLTQSRQRGEAPSNSASKAQALLAVMPVPSRRR